MRIVTIPGSWYGREAVFSDDDIVALRWLQAVCRKILDGAYSPVMSAKAVRR